MIAWWMIARLEVRSVLISLGVLLVLFMIVDFLDSARYLLSGKSPVLQAILFYLCKVPAMIHMLLPIALLLGTRVAFALMGRKLELRALAASGVSPFQMFSPVLCVALFVTFFSLVFSELLVPPAYDKLESLMKTYFGRIDSSWRFFRSNMWIQGQGNQLLRVSSKSRDGRHLKGVIIFHMDEEFHLQQRQDIRQLNFVDGTWVATGMVTRTFSAGQQESYLFEKKAELNLGVGPDRFVNLSGRPLQKNLIELKRTIELLEERGLSANEYRLAWHNRFAFPSVGLALLLFLFPFYTQPGRQRSLAGALLESVGAIFVAYFLIALSTTAVSGTLFDPWIGAWLPPLVLVACAVPRWAFVLKQHLAQVKAG